MKKFSYVAEFMKKDPQNPSQAVSVERHLFVFLVQEKEDEKGPSRFIKWWDASF